MVKNFNSSKSNTSEVGGGGGEGGGPDPAQWTKHKFVKESLGMEDVAVAPGGDGKAGGGGGGTTGLKSTLGMMKSAFTLTTVIVLVAAGADVYKM